MGQGEKLKLGHVQLGMRSVSMGVFQTSFLSKSCLYFPQNKLRLHLFSPRGGGLCLLSGMTLTLTIPSFGTRKRVNGIQESFRSFVDRTLALQGGAPISKFSLKCGDEYDEGQVVHWICNALETGTWFSSFDSVWFTIKEFSDVFLAACPALDDLTIHHKSFPGRPDVISSKTIKVTLGMGSVSMDCVASLNCLPDELLVKILSSLPTKPAAATSILSKKWRTLFAFRQDFDFDDSIFWYPEVGKEERDDIQESFRSFVDRTLELQGGGPIRKFLLKCGDKHDEVHVDGWINHALEHGVSELYLDLTDDMQRLLPSNLFISKTMVKLTLGTEISIDCIPSKTSLPVLKVLFVNSVWFEDNEFSKLFLAGCPALEDLTINHQSFPGMIDVISSKTVRRLSITYNCADYVDPYSFISLDTPNVVNLFYADYARRWYPNCNLDSVSRATLDLHFLEHDFCLEPLDPNVTGLINALRNVKILKLTSFAVEVIAECCKGGLPVFKNLTGLGYSGSKESGWVLLPLLLENSPNLKALVLAGLDRCTYEDQFVGIRIPPNNKVKMLRVFYYQGTAIELKHISHFLLKMEYLEVVQIRVTPGMDDAKKAQLREDLLKLPAVSSKLDMEVI